MIKKLMQKNGYQIMPINTMFVKCSLPYRSQVRKMFVVNRTFTTPVKKNLPGCNLGQGAL